MALVTANSRLSSSATTTANSNSNLPEDVIFEVLSRLPVKALIRFKSSCRSWYDLISNPNFISTHLINNSTNSVRCDDDDDNFCGLKVVAFDMVNKRYPTSIFHHLHLNLNVDFEMKETPLDVVGYCDGMFCLSSRPVTNSSVSDVDRKRTVTIILHNPALRETRVLPPSQFFYPANQGICRYSVGFGFDQKTKDYIVVKMVIFKKIAEHDVASVETESVLEVYSLSTNSWRVVDNAVKDLDTNASSTMVIRDFRNGILCLFNNNTFDEYNVVVPFYIDEEMFSMRLHLPKPHYTFNWVPLRFRHLRVLNRKLAFIRYYLGDGVVDGHTWVEIWVITTNSCDVEKPWSLVSTVESLPGMFRVLGFWNTKVLMLYDYRSGCTILYDLVTKQSTDLQLGGELDFFYKESLVSVKSTTIM